MRLRGCFFFLASVSFLCAFGKFCISVFLLKFDKKFDKISLIK